MSKRDNYHNEFLNTNDLLVSGFFEHFNGDLDSLDKEVHREDGPRDNDENTFFMTERPERNSSGRRRQRRSTTEGNNGERRIEAITEIDIFKEKIASLSTSAKDLAISLYTKISDDNRAARDMHDIIRTLEDMEISCGIELEKPFDPLRHASGLKEKDILVNANRVVGNTLENYDLYILPNIMAGVDDKKECPVIAATIVGEHSGVGFIVKALVYAEDDFAGSESLDYVHAPGGGLVSVKSFSRGRWNDVSDNFIIKSNTKEYRLDKLEEWPHSLFIGEKIVGSGKENIKKELKLNDEAIKFGKHQVFAKEASTIENVRKLFGGENESS